MCSSVVNQKQCSIHSGHLPYTATPAWPVWPHVLTALPHTVQKRPKHEKLQGMERDFERQAGHASLCPPLLSRGCKKGDQSILTQGRKLPHEIMVPQLLRVNVCHPSTWEAEAGRF